MKVLFNLFWRDIEAHMRFYASLLQFTEIHDLRSQIFRALTTGDTELGFNSEAAYELLDLSDRRSHDPENSSVTAYATFMLDVPADVDTAASQCVALGGGIVKLPYLTY